MAKHKLTDPYLTVVFDTTSWDDVQLSQMAHREDARALSWSHALHERDKLREENLRLKEEVNRLIWASQEHD